MLFDLVRASLLLLHVRVLCIRIDSDVPSPRIGSSGCIVEMETSLGGGGAY